MFFEIFWATYVPIALIIVYLVEESLKQYSADCERTSSLHMRTGAEISGRSN